MKKFTGRDPYTDGSQIKICCVKMNQNDTRWNFYKIWKVGFVHWWTVNFLHCRRLSFKTSQLLCPFALHVQHQGVKRLTHSNRYTDGSKILNMSCENEPKWHTLEFLKQIFKQLGFFLDWLQRTLTKNVRDLGMKSFTGRNQHIEGSQIKLCYVITDQYSTWWNFSKKILKHFAVFLIDEQHLFFCLSSIKGWV